MSIYALEERFAHACARYAIERAVGDSVFRAIDLNGLETGALRRMSNSGKPAIELISSLSSVAFSPDAITLGHSTDELRSQPSLFLGPSHVSDETLISLAELALDQSSLNALIERFRSTQKGASMPLSGLEVLPAEGRYIEVRKRESANSQGGQRVRNRVASLVRPGLEMRLGRADTEQDSQDHWIGDPQGQCRVEARAALLDKGEMECRRVGDRLDLVLIVCIGIGSGNCRMLLQYTPQVSEKDRAKNASRNFTFAASRSRLARACRDQSAPCLPLYRNRFIALGRHV
jgi:hypothetical protein